MAWYNRMLEATFPHGLIAAYTYWAPPPGYMYVYHGPAGVDRFELPPPGEGAGSERGPEAEYVPFRDVLG